MYSSTIVVPERLATSWCFLLREADLKILRTISSLFAVVYFGEIPEPGTTVVYIVGKVDILGSVETE